MKKSLAYSMLEKQYEQKAEKQLRISGSFQKAIAKSENKKNEINSELSFLDKRIETLTGELNGITNASNYLVGNRGQSDNLDKVINLLIYNNNRKAISLSDKLRKLELKRSRMSQRISDIEEEISLNAKNVEYHSKSAADIKSCQSKINALSNIGIENPLLAAYIAKHSDEVIDDIKRYCYKELSDDQLEKLDNLDFAQRPSKTNAGHTIIRFERSDMDKFEAALA